MRKQHPWVSRARQPLLAGPLALLAVTLLLFGDVLFGPPGRVLSQLGTDLSSYFLYAREFGFRELRQGNLPLWNPHLFSGAPFLGNAQTALLYPPNWIYLLLPLDRAINVEVALHVFLTGLFTYLWALHRGLRPEAAFVSGTLLMFGGPFFLHVYAGHLAPLAVMAWAPLLLLAGDRLLEKPALGPCLLGVFAAAMQLLAGHPQYAFYCAVALALYAGLRLVALPRRGMVLLGLAAFYAGAAAIGAVQLLASMDAAAETTRGAAVPYRFAAAFSFPPENLLTLALPGLFGSLDGFPYWGRWYLWEMSLFMGVGGCTLAIYGALRGHCPGRHAAWIAAVVLLVLALGAYTPLFPALYAWVPGFNRFRGMSKFIFPAALFLALLAGMGADALLRSPEKRRLPGVLLLAAGLAAALLAAAAAAVPGLWSGVVAAIAETRESFVSPERLRDAEFARRAGAAAAGALLLFAGTSAVLALLFWLQRVRPRAALLILAVAVAEVLFFARSARPVFPVEAVRPAAVEQFLAGRPGDYRILNAPNPNSALAAGARDIWGYDPLLPGRYAEWMAFTQGQDPDRATMYVRFRDLHPLYRMLRCRFGFFPEEGGRLRVAEERDPLPRLLLVDGWEAAPDREAAFAAMVRPGFDPRRTVLLESAPAPRPEAGAAGGTLRILDESTDHLTLEASLASPAILLRTDAYSRGWRAVAMPGSAQSRYEVLPANHVLQAVPLSAGTHRLRLEYAPAGFLAGRWISAAALLAYLALLGYCWQRSRR